MDRDLKRKGTDCLNPGAIPQRDDMRAALLERHGKELQEALDGASVAICGLGGLGSNVAVALARAGVGRLHLIDFDVVDVSNLNRQQYFADQVGLSKTEALRDNLLRISPYMTVDTDSVRIVPQNASELLAGEDIVCEAFDSAEDKAMLVNLVLEEMPEKYVVAASGMAGLSSANSIKTRRITERFYICGDGSSDIEDGMGLVASRVMVCAAHQANAILRIIAGEYDA